jgi:hypothetical protein
VRGRLDDQAGLVAIFGGRGALQSVHLLNRVDGYLVGKDPALLIGNGLPVHTERGFRVLADRVENAV